ncbi:ribonuclease Z [Brevipalpus obovatus]|uniref:ribonuclease Z n=1 Tax=Brevipalpus obovatus TaxID=246614 RepID=UPI003D9F940B
MRISLCCLSFSNSNLRKVLTKVKESTIGGIDMASWFPASLCFNICGNGHQSGFRNVVLTGDHKTYLFNCGEGFQRNIYLTKTKIKSFRNVFITHRSWENMSGLPGLIMMMDTEFKSMKKWQKGSGNDENLLSIHGPTFDGLSAMASASAEGKLNFSCKIQKETKFFEDELLRIEMIPLLKKRSDECAKRIRYDDYCYAYKGKTKTVPGKLLITKCMELKVPRGPLLAKLKAGEDIQLEDGRTIHSSDVTEPSKPGLSFVILECPSEDYLDSLVDQEALLPNNESSPSVIIHFTPPEVVISAQYQDWIRKFPSTVDHLGVNKWNPSLVNFSILNLKTSKIDDKIFCLPHQSQEPDARSKELNILPCETSLLYHLHPDNKKGIDKSIFEEGLKDYNDDQLDELLVDLDEFDSSIKEYKEKIAQLPACDHPYPAVAFLGTGSAIPSKYRNSSCIMMELSEDSLFMFDCGEGSLGQILRFYGPLADEKIKNIKAVFLSHYHADHQIGIMSFLLYRRKLTKQPLLLVCSSKVAKLLQKFSYECENIEDTYRLAYSQDLINGTDKEVNIRKFGLKDLRTCRVDHCIDSFGIIIETDGPDSKKIVYSGDAMPTKSLIRTGKDCDLLIHEATFEDSLADEAILKRHSTFSQALGVREEMKAKFTILTHFSQRYHKIPSIPEKFPSDVGIAYDYMRVEFDNFSRLPLLTKALKILFFEDYAILEKQQKARDMKLPTEEIDKLVVDMKKQRQKLRSQQAS